MPYPEIYHAAEAAPHPAAVAIHTRFIDSLDGAAAEAARAHRACRFVVNVAAMYEDPAARAEHAAWAAGLAAEPTRQRLAAIKWRYDPPTCSGTTTSWREPSAPDAGLPLAPAMTGCTPNQEAIHESSRTDDVQPGVRDAR